MDGLGGVNRSDVVITGQVVMTLYYYYYYYYYYYHYYYSLQVLSPFSLHYWQVGDHQQLPWVFVCV